MPKLNDIHILLDIQDKNLIFEENCVTKGLYKTKPCKYVHGTLTYTPACCVVCDAVNENHMVYKNGTQLSRITLPITGVNPTYLLLKKQRFMCKHCQNSFTAQTPIVQKNCHISKNVKAHIILKSAEAQSLTSIARDCSVSPHTVQREINEVAQQFKPHLQALPKHLSFDEFKHARGAMAFEYINVLTGDILDILERRDKQTIKNHFMRNYSVADRNLVKTVTIDMNAGYQTVIKELFPHAEIIIDRFHLVQLINRSMNKCRIQVMNQLRTSKSEDMKKYRRLKCFWKLLLKNAAHLSHTEYKQYPLFGQRLEASLVEELLTYSPILRENYDWYQALLKAMSNRDFKSLEACLARPASELLSSYMKTSLSTLRKHLPFIKNSFIYPYNNGRIEGINNKIKVLNRVAYGYRNFMNFKKRILIHFKFKPVNMNQENQCPKVG